LISLAMFYRAYELFRPKPNEEQHKVVNADLHEPLFIVAGPGTGKTATLTLRILKLILVDGVAPRSILATTFTKKAAEELRSRILGWGFRLVEALQNDSAMSAETQARIARVDINQVITGTIDSICERLMREFREPASQPPVLADEFVAKTLFLREGLFGADRYKNTALDGLLFDLSGKSSRYGWHVGAKNDVLQNIWDRRFQDQVRWHEYLASNPTLLPALTVLDEAMSAYQQALTERGMVDFTMVEQAMLEKLNQGQPQEFLQQIRVLLVDEYQDTNLLQESIYFALARACNGAITVVGDDDQSLYRFRGATVELFRDFGDRYQLTFGRQLDPIFLSTNYRSSQSIITFVNNYARLDTSFQQVRVNSKPRLVNPSNVGIGFPTLGLFRDDAEQLANDLANFIHEVFRGSGFVLSSGQVIQCDPKGGDLGDCALLCSSPAEYNSSNNPRLPLLLRQSLQNLPQPIPLFNPRGQDLTEIPVVAQFGGFLLECLDPGGVVQAQTRGLNQDIISVCDTWRNTGIDYAQSAIAPAGLVDFAVGWAGRDPGRSGWVWPRSVPVLDLIYALVHFFPELHDDPEGQIYLEIFTRQVSTCEQVGNFSGRVITDPANPGLSEASIKELLRDFLGPIASGTIKVNEELMESFPHNRLSVLSIHQSKGLEFPLTIVDVGSDFRINHAAHAFKRFPRNGGAPHVMEDTLRPFSALNRPTRSARDRAFDDLFRQFFVAFSRPQEVLLLVGLTPSLPGRSIQNVATGWNRNGVCQWNNQTLLLI